MQEREQHAHAEQDAAVMARLQTNQLSLAKENEYLRALHEHQSQERRQADKKLESLQAELKSSNQRVKEADSSNVSLRGELSSVTQKLTDTESSHDTLREELRTVRSQCEKLAQLQEDTQLKVCESQIL